MPTFQTSLDETPVTVHYVTHRASYGRTDGRFGPKLEPDEPAHLEIEYIETADGRDVAVTDAVEASLIEAIVESFDDGGES